MPNTDNPKPTLTPGTIASITLNGGRQLRALATEHRLPHRVMWSLENGDVLGPDALVIEKVEILDVPAQPSKPKQSKPADALVDTLIDVGLKYLTDLLTPTPKPEPAPFKPALTREPTLPGTIIEYTVKRVADHTSSITLGEDGTWRGSKSGVPISFRSVVFNPSIEVISVTYPIQK